MPNKYQNEQQDKRICRLEDDFKVICQNYNEEIGGVKEDIASIKANQKILVAFMLIQISAVIGLFFK